MIYSSMLGVKTSELGQSLVEVLIALAASVAVITAIAVTVITSLNNADFTKNQNLATEYARQGLEIVRQLAKNNWNDFLTYTSVNYCLPQDYTAPCPRGSTNCGTPTTCGLNINDPNGNKIFGREIKIIQTNPSYCTQSIEVLVSVSWTDSKCQSGDILCHKVDLISCLADVNSVKAP